MILNSKTDFFIGLNRGILGNSKNKWNESVDYSLVGCLFFIFFLNCQLEYAFEVPLAVAKIKTILIKCFVLWNYFALRGNYTRIYIPL